MNPFKMLGLGAEVGAEEIIQAAALALREKRHSARDIAEARRQLMEPELRPVLAFLYFTDTESLLRPPERSKLPADSLRQLEFVD